MLNQLIAKQAGHDSVSPTVKPFNQWIANLPKEKWSKLYDDGSRYGIMTTNCAESFNMVMRGVRGLPLVGIVEFIMYGSAKYFRECYMAVSPSLNNPSVVFGYKKTEYLEDKIKKAQQYTVTRMGTTELRFEVTCNGTSSRGVHRDRIVHACVIQEYGRIRCKCFMPKLYRMPCSHVIAACRELGVSPVPYFSAYYRKEAIASTWNQEVYGYATVGTFT